MKENQPRQHPELKIETIEFKGEERACIHLENGLLFRLPPGIKSYDDFGEYEWKTLKALQTDEGLEFVTKANRKFEVNLNIGTNDKKWFTTASVFKHEDNLVFSLYHGAN